MPDKGRYNRPAKVYRYALLAAFVLACGLCWRLLLQPKIADLSFPSFRAKHADAQPRRIYPYSVIIGGAYSSEELVRARKIDRVVERHYAGFGSSTKVQQMPADALMYVSYRKSNQVFWSKAKHRIPKGETVLCDGDNFARTRCGNRLSFKPQAPVSPQDEPTEEAMDIPDQPKASLLASKPTLSLPDADFFVPVSPADLQSLLSPPSLNAPAFANNAVPVGSERPYSFGSPPGASPFLGNSLAYPGAASTTTSNSPSNSNPSFPGNGNVVPSPADTVLTPEPGSLPLVFVGFLLSSFLFCKARRSRILR